MRIKVALLIHADDNGGDFKQRIALSIEPAGLHIHDYRQEAAEPVGHQRRHAVVELLHRTSISVAPAIPFAIGQTVWFVFVLSHNIHLTVKLPLDHAPTRRSPQGKSKVPIAVPLI
jgi:hypothetical protein